MQKPKKSLIGAEVVIQYEDINTLDGWNIKGKIAGFQCLFTDRDFLIVKLDSGIDRAIPVDKIIHIDILKSTISRDKPEETSNYHG
jgi:hypothetical protein